MKKLALAATLLLSTLTVAACDLGSVTGPTSADLAGGGVYVAYNLNCDKGCDQIAKGDLIQKIDGKAVATRADALAANLIDGQEHTLEVLDKATKQTKTVALVAKPNANVPPFTDLQPFWMVGAEELDRAPEWARRRMFGHASPMVQLVSIEGGIIDGRALRGKKRVIVYWDNGLRPEEAEAMTFYKILQMARPQLEEAGYEIMFTQVKFPGNTRTNPLNDTDLRDWAKRTGMRDEAGKLMKPLPLFRFPNTNEYNASRELGLENAFTVFENLGSPTTVLVMDEDGLIRWHSEGSQTPPEGSKFKEEQADQYTINEVVQFALTKM